MPESSLSDIELFKLFQSGNTAAFDELYERYWEKLYLVAYRKLNSEEDAQDIVQNVFIWVWEKRNTISVNESFFAYLLTAVRNKSINLLASRLQINTHLEHFKMQSPKNFETTSQSVKEQEIKSLLDKSIAGMPQSMQKIFVLSRKHQLSSQEIAKQLNISEQTVRNQISNALHIVRMHLKDYLVSITLGFLILILI
jgi:RNA polymerase sigma-70 factor (ECF subfamily)